MASRGEDVSAFFTNQFTVVRPDRPALPDALAEKLRDNEVS